MSYNPSGGGLSGNMTDAGNLMVSVEEGIGLTVAQLRESPVAVSVESAVSVLGVFKASSIGTGYSSGDIIVLKQTPPAAPVYYNSTTNAVVTPSPDHLTSLGSTDIKLDVLHSDLGDANTNLTSINTNASTTNSRLTSTNTKLDTLHTDVSSTNTKLDTVNTTIGTSNTKLDTINTTLGGLTTINTSVGSTNTKLDTVINSYLAAFSQTTGTSARSTILQVGGSDGSLARILSVNSSGHVNIADGGNSITVDGTIAATQSGTWTVQPGNTANTTPWLFSLHDGTTKATVRELGVNDALNVAIVDDTGNQILSFGGHEYQEDVASSGSEYMILSGFVRQDTPTANTSATGDFTYAKTDNLGRIWVNSSGVTQPVSGPLTDAQLRATAVPVSGTLTANLGTLNGAATAALQQTLIDSLTTSGIIVKDKIFTSSTSFTRGANTTIYDSGDVIGTEVASIMTFAAVGDSNGQIVNIRSVTVDYPGTFTTASVPWFWLYLSPTSLSSDNDNSPVTLSDAERSGGIFIPVTESLVIPGGVILSATNLDRIVKLGASSTALYGILMIGNGTFTPPASGGLISVSVTGSRG